MQTIIADYSGLLLVLFTNLLIAGPAMFSFFRLYRRPGMLRHAAKIKMMHRLRLTYASCTVSFVILSATSTFFNEQYFGENIMWGGFCVLALIGLNGYFETSKIGGER